MTQSVAAAVMAVFLLMSNAAYAKLGCSGLFHECEIDTKQPLLLKTELERRMKFANLQREWAQVIRGLEALQQVEATFQDKRFVLRSQLTSEASAALRATGVAAPPTLREVS